MYKLQKLNVVKEVETNAARDFWLAQGFVEVGDVAEEKKRPTRKKAEK